MTALDLSSLPGISDSVNGAHFFKEKITKTDARSATRMIEERYRHDLPVKILEMENPDPKWAAVARSFALSNEEKKLKQKTFTGEPQTGASMRAVQSREAARALIILGAITGKTSEQATEHNNGMLMVAGTLRNSKVPLF
jgi:hypothetical protein